MQLIKSNAAALDAGVSVNTFPKTIKDAVYFTARIGLRWLWADSLCIVQDSSEDKIREIKSMDSVYQNCFISIAALDATNSDQGLFACRDLLMYAECELARPSDGHAIVVTRINDHLVGRIINSPLYQRGWVLQERILPPRTVIFGRTVAWDCRKGVQYESDRSVLATSFSIMKVDFFDAVTKLEGILAATDTKLIKIHETWNIILKEYSTT
jgi:hypothetical protein